MLATMLYVRAKPPGRRPPELMRQEAEGIRIPLEVEEVLPASTLGTYQRLPALPWAFAEVSTDRTLSAVPKGGIPPYRAPDTQR